MDVYGCIQGIAWTPKGFVFFPEPFPGRQTYKKLGLIESGVI